MIQAACTNGSRARVWLDVPAAANDCSQSWRASCASGDRCGKIRDRGPINPVRGALRPQRDRATRRRLVGHADIRLAPPASARSAHFLPALACTVSGQVPGYNGPGHDTLAGEPTR